MAYQVALCNSTRPVHQVRASGRTACSSSRCLVAAQIRGIRPASGAKRLLTQRGFGITYRTVSRSIVTVKADANAEIRARTTETTTPPADLTQALAVAAFLAVRYSALHIDAQLILRSLAVLQLLVAGIALLTRGVHTDRVSGVIGPCALALYALNYSRIDFLTALTALFGYNLSEQLPGPYYVWAITLAGALYYGYGTWWYTAGVSILALWNLFETRGLTNVVASVGTLAVSGYVAYHEATAKWVMVLVSAQIAWSCVRTVLGGLNLAQ